MHKILALLLLTLSSCALASDNKLLSKRFYLGAGIGSFTYDPLKTWDNSDYYGTLAESTTGNTVKIYAGYQLNHVTAIEVAYNHYGDSEGYINTPSKQTVIQSPTSLSVAANSGYTFNNGVRPFALLGLAYLTLNSSYDFIQTDKPIAIKYGLGIEYRPLIFPEIQFRLSYEADTYFGDNNHDAGNDFDIDIFSLRGFYAGASYRF